MDHLRFTDETELPKAGSHLLTIAKNSWQCWKVWFDDHFQTHQRPLFWDCGCSSLSTTFTGTGTSSNQNMLQISPSKQYTDQLQKLNVLHLSPLALLHLHLVASTTESVQLQSHINITILFPDLLVLGVWIWFMHRTASCQAVYS